MPTTQALPRLSAQQELRNAIAFDRDPVRFLRSTQAEAGDIFRFSKSEVVLLHPDAIAEVLAGTDGEFVLNGVRADEGGRTFWSSARTAAATVLSRPRAIQRAPQMAAAFGRHYAALVGRELPVFELFLAACAESVAGLCATQAGSELLALTVTHMDLAQSAAVITTNLPRWVPHGRVRRLRRSEADIRTRVLQCYEQLRGGPVHGDGFLEALARDGTLASDDVMTVMRSMLLGSIATPAMTLSWAVRTLSHHPEELELLRAEIDEHGLDQVIADPHATAPRLLAVIREVMRLDPPWMLQRVVATDVVVGGVRLEAGVRVLFSPYMLHHDPRWWDEPETFAPDRWAANARPYHRRAYRPFGGGPRSCPGAQLALVQVACGLATLVASYDISLSGSADAGLHPLGLRAPFRLRASLRKRDTR